MTRATPLAWGIGTAVFALRCSPFSGTGPPAVELDADAPDARSDAGADPALVARWAFDEGPSGVALDSSGHGHDGKLNAGASRTEGIFGGAIRFDRDAGGSVIASSPGFGVSSLTVTAWVKSKDTASRQSRICGAGFGSAAYLFLNFNMGFPSQEAQTQRAFWTVESGGPSIADDQWHHVASVLDRTRNEVRVFVDGNLASFNAPVIRDALADDAFGDPSASYPFVIGSQSTSFSVAFGGTLDEVRVYGRTLDPTEIAELARRP